MNEPYQRVHKEEDSNSTLYRNIGVQVGVGLAFQGGQEILLQTGYRKAKNPDLKEGLRQALYTDSDVKTMGLINPLTGTDYYPKIKEGKIKDAVGKLPVFGQSTLKGRVMGYGGAVAGGLIGGILQTKAEQELKK